MSMILLSISRAAPSGRWNVLRPMIDPFPPPSGLDRKLVVIVRIISW
jgi:hypothetical protein